MWAFYPGINVCEAHLPNVIKQQLCVVSGESLKELLSVGPAMIIM